MSVPSDNPIEHSSEDALGRAAAAQAFGDQILGLDASKGLVVGVLGPWGSGKTSFINMAREHVADRVTLLDFNPWMFSGAEQLVQSFFTELAAQLKLRGFSSIGDDLADYGEAFAGLGWLPFLGPWIERGRGAAKVLGKLVERRRQGVEGRRRKLEAALASLDQPIVVVLDDIDRLSTAEIRDVFKLVRLTASFPNVIYLVAFDRARVEAALAEEGIPGRDYLEKILQVAIDLPTVPSDVLIRVTVDALDEALRGTAASETLNEEVWPDVFMEVIRPLIRNMRDVRRYAAAVRGTASGLGAQIAVADVLGVEAIRIFLPDVFARFQIAVEPLTTPSTLLVGGREDPPQHEEAIKEMLDVAGDRSEIVRAAITRLFPFAQRYVGGTNYGSDFERRFLRERRIGHQAILKLYLERVASEQLSNFMEAERAWELLADREELDTFLRSLEPQRREDVVAALEAYEDDYRPEQVVPAVIVLMNLLPDLPERQRGMFDLDTRLVVGRVSYRLLRSLSSKDAVQTAVREVLPQVSTLSSKWEVITDVGYREGAGHKLVSESAAKDLEREWAEEVRSASAAQLAREPDLVRLLFFANEASGEPINVPDDPAVTLAALKSVLTESRSQSMGSRAVRRAQRLAWDLFVEVYGGEDVAKERLAALKSTDLAGNDDLLELADRYAGGWRPPEFMGREGEEDEEDERPTPSKDSEDADRG